EIAAHAFCSFPEAVELFMYNLPKSTRMLKEKKPPKPIEKVLSEEQKRAADRIWESEEKVHLLYGVTGSGKTEVYFELIRRALDAGKKALFLLPEISLTPQMTDRIQKTFSGRKIAVIHSKITDARRARFMADIAQGNVDIVLGARSAVLAPLRNIGIVVIDECHETSYMQENRPRYNATAVARKLAELEGARLVLGSATPDVCDYYAHDRKGTLVSLTRRYADYAMPHTVVVDMRHESDKIVSSQLDRGIRDRLEKNEQIILFINRKGYSSAVQCDRCGYVFRCPNCEIAKTYYRSIRRLNCNYCDHSEPVPHKCPECGNEDLDFSGIGTEKIEAEIRSRYPNAIVSRIDRSVMTSHTRLTEITSAFEEGKIDILIGTQMIAKGLDFPKVTLVGIMSADLQLYIPHYSASEKAFQLFTQVSGRAGRSGLRSEVMIQTYSPHHMSISSEDYLDFYRKELIYRGKIGYPPYRSVVTLIFSDEDEAKARESAYRSKKYLRKKMEMALLDKHVKIFDEVPAALKKLDKHYRYQVLMIAENEVFERVLALVRLIEGKLQQTTKSQIVVEIN
ncbi:MAG: primosomal protein N', partial [Bacillota bacterium]|nr:primosomal protein N' [Bacillota bacterium]